jgi:hypothetical protein
MINLDAALCGTAIHPPDVSLWVNRVVLGALADVGSSPISDRTSYLPKRSLPAALAHSDDLDIR